jgi:hypothetical protein
MKLFVVQKNWNAAQQILRAGMPRNKSYALERRAKKSYALECRATNPTRMNVPPTSQKNTCKMTIWYSGDKQNKCFVYVYYLDVDRDGSAVLQLNNIAMDVGVVVLRQGPLEEAGPPFLQDPPYVLRFSVVKRQAAEVRSVEVRHRHFPKGDSLSLRHASFFFGQ